MKYVKIINQENPEAGMLFAGYCDSFLCRLRGMTFRREIPHDHGLLLVEGADSRMQTAVHMLFVFFNLGIIWINDAGQVVDTRLAKSWISFIMPTRPARYVLEIHPDRLSEFKIGDRIRFEEGHRS